MKTLMRKFRTVITFYKERGFVGVLRLLKRKLLPPVSYKGISESVRSHLSVKDSTYQVCNTLGEGVKYVISHAVDGDLAEFGTMSGNTAVALATAITSVEEDYLCDPMRKGRRSLWLFDSFEGLPEARFEADVLSFNVSDGVWGKGTCKGLTSRELTSVVSKYLVNNELKVIKGWFRETVPLIPSETKFALVHIDSDLYESAIDALDGLLSRNIIAEGAIIYFDDWNDNRANPETGERLAWSKVVEKYQIRFSPVGAYGVDGYRLIIHSYIG